MVLREILRVFFLLCILRAVIFCCKTEAENAIQLYLNGTANDSLSNETTKMCSFVKFWPRQF